MDNIKYNLTKRDKQLIKISTAKVYPAEKRIGYQNVIFALTVCYFFCIFAKNLNIKFDNYEN